MSHKLYEVPDFYFDELSNFYESSGFYQCIILEQQTNKTTGKIEAKVIVLQPEMMTFIPLDILEKHALPESI